MSDSALRCPGCGAPATKDAACCDYCGSALATMTCASCFGAMFVGSRFCNHCGAENQRELVEDDVELHCPRCQQSLQGLKLGSTAASECGACGGIWLVPDTLQRLVTAKEEGAAVVSALAARIPTATVPPNAVTYIPCPRCRKLMNRTNFGHASGIILDICKTDGLWLDRGELQAVLNFVESGGLTVARERGKEMEKAEEKRSAIVAMEVARLRVSGGGYESGAARSWDTPESAASAVAGFLFRAALNAMFR